MNIARFAAILMMCSSLSLAYGSELSPRGRLGAITAREKAAFLAALEHDFEQHQKAAGSTRCPFEVPETIVLFDMPTLYVVSIQGVTPCSAIRLTTWKQGALVLEGGKVRSMDVSRLISAPQAVSGGALQALSELPSYTEKLKARLSDEECRGWAETKVQTTAPAFFFQKNGVVAYPEKYPYHPCWPGVAYAYEELKPYLHPALRAAVAP